MPIDDQKELISFFDKLVKTQPGFGNNTRSVLPKIIGLPGTFNPMFDGQASRILFILRSYKS